MTGHRRRVALAVLIVTGLVAAGCGSKKSTDTAGTTEATATTSSTASGTTGTSVGATTTSGGSTTSTAAPQTGVWPLAGASTHYTDPVEAARTFAVDYLGFGAPVVGAFQAGDSRSGEVEVRPEATGPVTTVLVRMLAPDDSWWVLGTATANIQLTSPTALATISSPVTLTGQSTAFEATVNVQIRQDSSLTPVKEDIVMGGANGEMGPFSKAISFDRPPSRTGAIVLKTISAKDGTTWEASVLLVNFA